MVVSQVHIASSIADWLGQCYDGVGSVVAEVVADHIPSGLQSSPITESDGDDGGQEDDRVGER